MQVLHSKSTRWTYFVARLRSTALALLAFVVNSAFAFFTIFSPYAIFHSHVIIHEEILSLFFHFGESSGEKLSTKLKLRENVGRQRFVLTASEIRASTIHFDVCSTFLAFPKALIGSSCDAYYKLSSCWTMKNLNCIHWRLPRCMGEKLS